MDLDKIGILGYKGRLGSELMRRGCIPIDCDATKIPNILDVINNKIFDCVINCVGYTNVDDCENDILNCYRINSIVPDNIVRCFQCKIIHISTDYLFSGVRGLYSELDIPEPQTVYGWGKFWGEIPIRSAKDHLIVRTTILYDAVHNKPNFIKTVYNNLKSNIPVKVPVIYGTPTYIPHLVDSILFSIANNIHGILNIVGRDWLSRVELALKIADKFGYDRNLVSEGPAWGDAKRSKYYGLSVEKADILGVPIHSLDEGLDEFGKVMNEQSSVNLDNA